MNAAKVTVEYDNGFKRELNFKTFEMNLAQDIDLDPSDSDGPTRKLGEHQYRLGSKYAVLFGFLQQSE